MSCCNNTKSNQEGMLIVNKAREAAACAEANCESSFTNAFNAAGSANSAATSATNAANSATSAATSATNAENSWLEFNALYLGAFTVAPTTDNEGNPLQNGALYWNLGSNTMFVWNGSVWIENGNFDEFTNFMLPNSAPIQVANLVTGREYEINTVGTANWTAIGAPAAAVGVRFTKNAVAATGGGTARITRDLVTRFADVANVKDYGAIGDNIADDTAAIQNAILFNAGSCIYFPRGRYKITNTIKIPSSKTSFVSDFPTCAEIILHNTSVSAALEFKSDVSGSSLFANSLINMVITGTPSSNYQVGVYIERPQDFTMTTCGISDFATCLKVRGGFNCRYNSLRIGPNLSTNADVGKGAIEIGAATVGTAFDGYTHQFTNCLIGGNKTEYAVVFRGNDYATFSNCSISTGKKGAVLIEADSSSPSGNYNNNFDNCYFDRVSRTVYSGTDLIGITINDQTTPPPQNSTDQKITDCVFTNFDISILINKAFDPSIEITGCRFSGSSEAAIQATGNFTNLLITGNQFYNNTATTSGNAVLNILDVFSATITGNIFSFIETLFPFPGTRDAIRLAGTIEAATITGNTFNTFTAGNITDLANTATITRFVVTGNASDNPNNTIVGSRIGNQANSNSLMLDWYEEKTFNPTLEFGGSSAGVVYQERTGTATRIGNRVFFDLYMRLDSKGVHAAGATAVIKGLPFAYNSVAPTNYVMTIRNFNTSVGDANIDAVPSGTDGIEPRIQGAGGSFALTYAEFDDDSYFAITGTYLAQ